MFYLLRLYIPLSDPFITDRESLLKWFGGGKRNAER